jgi:peptidyl-prolyl cis-trans isomerase A (cyclophilin A)
VKKKAFTLVFVAAVMAAVATLYHFQPPRLTPGRLDAMRQSRIEIDRIEQMRADAAKKAEAEKTDEVTLASQVTEPAETKPAGQEAAAPETKAAPTEGGKSEVPDVFKVKVECSNGTFVVECQKAWAPLGVERFHKLVTEGFFTDVRFFRMVTQPRPFVVQFGISGDPGVAKKWRDAKIKDDPGKQSNKKGTLTFACAGPNTRTTQLFINLGDNAFLDDMGFSPIGKVVEGMDVVSAFNSKYQDEPTAKQGQITAQGNAYLDKEFPGLDYIKSATIVQ